MKYAKSAAIVAGSVMALGAAAPAFAAHPAAAGNPAAGKHPVAPGVDAEAGAPKMSLNGGLSDALQSRQLDGHQFRPLVKKVKNTGEKVKSASANKLINGASEATRTTPLLGGLPLKLK
ncbi:hypothetical protein [Streptomyces sp. NBRC 110611]|uniref:hypothetical protein n=1 Tax=Streptomyces sp. NBRC 110611 TaxID=1621259 RepID=UPI0008309BC6|nr:hypothetical protein [Streptomyces sp. NBRC 110611]